MSLWDKYTSGDLPHIHIYESVLQNIFEDALSIQAERILKNLSKAFPDKSRGEIRGLMFESEVVE